MDLPIYRSTRADSPIELDKMRPSETELVRALFNTIIADGTTYPQDRPLNADAFANYWLQGDAFVVRSRRDANISPSQQPDILGAFYIKPNFPGRCSHICNAGFIVAPTVRGQGIGRLMGEAMLSLAQDLGYRAVMFNLVFETNIPSLRLWETLGFKPIGQIPAAAHLPDGRYVDAIMLYKSLN